MNEYFTWGPSACSMHRTRSSAFQLTIETMLKAMADVPGFESEFVPSGDAACFVLDVAWPHKRVALEVDGPHHFRAATVASNALMLEIADLSPEQRGSTSVPELPVGEFTLNASSVHARNMLRKLGWTVVNVSCLEWNRLASDGERFAYIREQLAPTGVLSPRK
jgi:hypothetical protein